MLIVALCLVQVGLARVCGGAAITATGVHFPCLKVSEGGGSSSSSSSSLYRVRMINTFQTEAAADVASCLLY